jgi:hypothetical protein
MIYLETGKAKKEVSGRQANRGVLIPKLRADASALHKLKSE